MEATLEAPKILGLKIPEYLIKETLNGKPIYYKDYKSVLFGQKNAEEIMGASSLQVLITNFINKLLLIGLDDARYFVFTGEVGLHLGIKNNLAGDILVYSVEQIPVFTKKYFDIPPILQIEIDVEIDNANFTDNQYVTQKTKRLLEFGVQKIIWIFSTTKTIWIAEPNQDWQIINWNNKIELLEGISMNLGEYLAKMNIEF
jgi:hypothetical protein